MILTELARIRQHGFTQREARAARGVQLAEAESLFTERNQEYSDSRRRAGLPSEAPAGHSRGPPPLDSPVRLCRHALQAVSAHVRAVCVASLCTAREHPLGARSVLGRN